MLPKRDDRDDTNTNRDRAGELPLASELLRQASTKTDEPAKKDEEKLSLFWRVFGGTILSIAALVLITIYQAIASSIHDLRTELSRVSESRAEFLKKDEFNTHKTSVWNRFENVTALSAGLSSVKDRVGGLEDHRKVAEAESKEQQALATAVNAVQARLSALDTQGKQIELTQKDVQTINVSLSAVQEKSRLRDEELKQIHEGLARDEANTSAALEAIKSRVSASEQALKQVEHDHKDLTTAQGTLAGLVEKSVARDAELKTVHDELKADADRLKTLADTLKDLQSAADAQCKRCEQDRKDLQQALTHLTAIQEKAAGRDAEIKLVSEERRRLEREFQSLRERMAKLEGAAETKATARPSPKHTKLEPASEEEAMPD